MTTGMRARVGECACDIAREGEQKKNNAPSVRSSRRRREEYLTFNRVSYSVLRFFTRDSLTNLNISFNLR